MRGPVETKVAAATAVPILVAALFGAATFYHWFTPPPAAVTSGLVALLAGAAGWLAPHTNRQQNPTIGQITSWARNAGYDLLARPPGTPARTTVVDTTGPPGSTITYTSTGTAPGPTQPPAEGTT